MAEPKIRFRRDDGSSYPAWNNKCFGDLFKKNNERNGDQFSEDRTISIASMSFSPNGNGADANSLSAYKVLRVGDVAFEGHENKEFSHGRFVMNDIGDGIMSPRFSCMRPITPMVNGFWKYYIHSEAVMRDILIRSTKKGTMMHELVFDDFFKQSIDVPCLEEQQKIADFLSAVDEVITASEAEVANLETQKKALMKKIFSQEVRFKKDDGTEFPEWEEKPFEEIASLITASIVPSKAGTMHCVELEHLEQGSGQRLGYVEAENQSSNKRLFETGDVLFGKLRPYLKKYWLATEDGCCSSEIWVLRPLSGVLSEYLLAIVSSDDFISVANTSEGTKMPRASWNLVANAEFPVPSFEEQRLIADFLSNFDEAIAAAKKELELWKELKKGLLQQMFV